MEHENYLGILFCSKGKELYIIKLIGAGASSFVYLATDKEKNNEYAIKLYIDNIAFKNEVQILSLPEINSSKNIVKLISHGQGFIERGNSVYSFKLMNNFNTGHVNYAIFEYLMNNDLHKYVLSIKKKFSEKMAKKIFLEIIKSLEVLQKNSISHGDIKLENILVSSNFSLKLIDFGFAKNTSTSKGNRTGLSGTKLYSAPEVFSSGKRGYNGFYSDIFSLGVTLFVLVTGVFPFDKPNITDGKYKYLMKQDYGNFWKKFEKKNGQKNNNNLSTEFKDLFAKMIRHDPNKRINLEKIKIHEWLKDITIIEDCHLLNKNIKNNNNFPQCLEEDEEKSTLDLNKASSSDKIKLNEDINKNIMHSSEEIELNPKMRTNLIKEKNSSSSSSEESSPKNKLKKHNKEKSNSKSKSKQIKKSNRSTSPEDSSNKVHLNFSLEKGKEVIEEDKKISIDFDMQYIKEMSNRKKMIDILAETEGDSDYD